VPVEERRRLVREVVETQPDIGARRYVTTGQAAAPTPGAVAAAADRIAVSGSNPLDHPAGTTTGGMLHSSLPFGELFAAWRDVSPRTG
jgi:hypothetical protein